MRAEAGGLLRAYVDGTPVITATDTSLAWGKMVLVSSKAAHKFGVARVKSLILAAVAHAVTESVGS